MYLKEIEASGFKSFADKLNIALDDNVTCIVGPNGSGKSNVVDAVRWVLGEQSVKSLRGSDTMSDVIFSGSKSRNQLNVASVTLTFDNSDHYLNVPYDNVSVKRRVYRTGENEYYLNGDKCRLKDITDLFLDSGIGKGSFNIIGQGEVSRIINSSSSDRRSIFEEAAGVLKYKKRKEEAIKKLDRTKDNMDRVSDIISELEVQVKPLEEQSKQAHIYIENKKALESIEVALLAYEITRINGELSIIKSNKDKLQEEIMVLNNETSNSSLDAKRVELMQIETYLDKLNKELLSIVQQEEKLNGEKKILQERSKYNANDTKIHDNIVNLTENKLRIEASISSLNLELTSINNDLLAARKTVNEIDSNLTNLNLKKENIRNEINNNDRESLSVNNRISVLKDYIEAGGNLSSSVKNVLNNPRLIGIHDVISNLITVDNKYTKALEISLGGAKEFIVCDNELSAKDAINYLKSNSLGRATFFPITVIKARGIDFETQEILKKENGYINTFSNLVSFDEKYRGIILNQLGNVIVASDINAATHIGKSIHNRYKVVTLDGDIVNVGGSMTGGAYKATRSIISDRGELEVLMIKSKNIANTLVNLNEEVMSLDTNIKKYETALNKAKSILFASDEAYKLKEQEISNKTSELENVTNELNALNHVKDDSLSVEEERIMNDFYQVKQKHDSLNIDIKDKNKEKDKLNNDILELEAKDKLTFSNLHKKESELRDLEISSNKMDVMLDNNLRILSEDYELTYDKAKEYRLEVDPSDARDKVNLYKNTIKKLGMVNLAAIEEYERVSTRYNFLLNQKEDLIKASDTLLEIIEEMDSVMKDEFTITFNKIEEQFKIVFKELFKGGTANLKLTDPDNPLTTGIDIIASPPGKKLSNISLLSGGEKTLTAISLLFAVLNVRTVPFCLFDEVEAALDEANVDNFGEYLNHYTNKTQFLLITHKKKTMEYAKTLYGITMQESGVSKLVSVKLQ